MSITFPWLQGHFKIEWREKRWGTYILCYKRKVVLNLNKLKIQLEGSTFFYIRIRDVQNRKASLNVTLQSSSIFKIRSFQYQNVNFFSWHFPNLCTCQAIQYFLSVRYSNLIILRVGLPLFYTQSFKVYYWIIFLKVQS